METPAMATDDSTEASMVKALTENSFKATEVTIEDATELSSRAIVIEATINEVMEDSLIERSRKSMKNYRCYSCCIRHEPAPIETQYCTVS
jgi:uncharacterized protein YdeI (YjbR/CyaY-like superfamily)